MIFNSLYTKSSFLVLFLIIAFQIYGQERRSGYIVLTSNDTLRGSIAYSRNSMQASYKSNSGEHIFTPEQIQVINLGEFGEFVSRDFESKRTIFQIHVSGPLTLLSQDQIFFLEKENKIYKLESKGDIVAVGGQPVQHESKKYIGVITYLTQDCQGLHNELTKLKPREKSLTDFVIAYNKCVNAESYISEYTKRKLKPSINLSIGYSNSTYKFRLSQSSQFTNEVLIDHTGSIGIGLEYRLNKFNTKTTFIPELRFSYFSYSQTRPDESGGLLYDTDSFSLSWSELKALNILKQKINRKNSLFLTAGWSISAIFNSNVQRTQVSETSGIIKTSKPFDFKNVQFGMMVGAGYDFLLKTNKSITIEARYNYENGVGRESKFQSATHHLIQILIGVRFNSDH